jgi:single-strand DNA-binding protein
MAFSLNRIQIIGNLGKDAEVRTTQNNTEVISYGVATTSGVKQKDGTWKDETTWHNVVAFNLSDYFKQRLVKGAKVYVEGRLKNRDYVDKNGEKRYVTEIMQEELIVINSPGGGASQRHGDNEEFHEPVRNPEPVNDEPPF